MCPYIDKLVRAKEEVFSCDVAIVQLYPSTMAAKVVDVLGFYFARCSRPIHVGQ